MATNNKALVGDLPIILSQSIPTALVKYKREDFAASYAIGNTPWLSAASDTNRISRITTTYQKERIDQGASAGENSLSNWWLRSATSWHKGEGERYYDADSSDQFRYYESSNIDVWTLGELSLLPAVTNTTTSAASSPVTVLGGTFYISGGDVKFYDGTTTTSTTLATSTVAQTMATDGTFAIVGANDGIYQVSTALVVTKLWNKPSAVTTQTVQAIAYVKERIIAGVKHDSTDMHVYELSRNPNSPPVHMSSSEIIFTYPNTSITFNSIAELPSSVIIGYTQGIVSRVLMYTINPSSPLAALTDGTVIAELPRGETLNQIRLYLNEFVVLATTKGIRIGEVGTDGQSFTYGPLNVEGAVSDIAFDDRYVYGCRSTLVSGSTGLWRINLGEPVGTGYAYASDLQITGTAPTGVSFVGTSGLKFITSASGTFVEHPTSKAENGYLKSGWIRWGTSENKQPVSIAIRTGQSTSLAGNVGFTIEDQEGNTSSIGAVPLVGSTDFQLSASLQPADHFEITLTMSRSTSNSAVAPLIEEWQCRALPAPIRSRTITVPLLCYEEEKDPNGITRVSSPWERIKYLERIEQNGGAVLYQDFASGEERVCVIRAIQFEQASPPPFANGFGGIVNVQLQTIDTEQAIQ